MDWKEQEEFDLIIGRLDNILSKMMLLAKRGQDQDKANLQTLKHHAEDMIEAGKGILCKIGIPPK